MIDFIVKQSANYSYTLDNAIDGYKNGSAFAGLVALSALKSLDCNFVLDSDLSVKVSTLENLIKARKDSYKGVIGTICWIASVALHIVSHPFSPNKWRSSEEQAIDCFNLLRCKASDEDLPFFDAKEQEEDDILYYDAREGDLTSKLQLPISVDTPNTISNNAKLFSALFGKECEKNHSDFSCKMEEVNISEIPFLKNSLLALQEKLGKDVVPVVTNSAVDFELFSDKSSPHILLLFPNPGRGFMLGNAVLGEETLNLGIYSLLLDKATGDLTFQLAEIKNAMFYAKGAFVLAKNACQPIDFASGSTPQDLKTRINNEAAFSILEEFLGGAGEYTIKKDEKSPYDYTVRLSKKLDMKPTYESIANMTCKGAHYNPKDWGYSAWNMAFRGFLGIMKMVLGEDVGLVSPSEEVSFNVFSQNAADAHVIIQFPDPLKGIRFTNTLTAVPDKNKLASLSARQYGTAFLEKNPLGSVAVHSIICSKDTLSLYLVCLDKKTGQYTKTAFFGSFDDFADGTIKKFWHDVWHPQAPSSGWIF